MSSPAAVSSFPYPGDDPATVRQAVADLRDGRRQLGALIDGLDGSLSSMVQSWQGTDAEAARVEVIALASAARLLADRVDDAIAAMDRHGDDLDRIRRSVDGLRGEWMHLDDPIATADVRGGWILPGPDPLAGMVTDPDRDPQLLARWQRLVQEQEESAGTCRSALAAAGGGSWPYAPGTGPVRGDLGSAIGLTELTFDDRLDSTQAWSGLTPEEQALFTAVGEDSLPVLLAGDPAAAADTWRGLDPMTRQALINTRAKDIGTIDGLPVDARDQANRLLLPEQRTALQAEVDALVAEGVEEGYAGGDLTVPFIGSSESDWMGRLSTARARLNALDDISGSVSAGTGTDGSARHTYVLALDVADRGRVAMAYGNPDTADQVVTLVPGTGSDLGGVLGDANRITLMMQAAEQAGGGTVTGVVWTDWQTPPDIGHAALEGYATEAADGLDTYAEGLRHSHEGDQPFRSVIAAHSYGTVLTAKAASGARTLDADALILLGSPGTDLPSVRDVRLTGVPADEVAQHVYATSSDADPVGDAPRVADLSLFGGMDLGVDGGPPLHLDSGLSLGFADDPTSPDWGATVFHTPADHSLAFYSFSDHSAYWVPDSAPLLTMGDIIADRYHGSRW